MQNKILKEIAVALGATVTDKDNDTNELLGLIRDNLPIGGSGGGSSDILVQDAVREDFDVGTEDESTYFKIFNVDVNKPFSLRFFDNDTHELVKGMNVMPFFDIYKNDGVFYIKHGISDINDEEYCTNDHSLKENDICGSYCFYNKCHNDGRSGGIFLNNNVTWFAKNKNVYCKVYYYPINELSFIAVSES